MNTALKYFCLVAATAALLGLSGCVTLKYGDGSSKVDGGSPTFDETKVTSDGAWRNPSSRKMLQNFGFSIYPRTEVSLVNYTKGRVAVEGHRINGTLFLNPGERVTVTITGYGSIPQEMAYFAFELDESGDRTGAGDDIVFRLGRRGGQARVFRIEHLH